ncbi:hypothetical protein Xkoz_02299 [Xenorhabdus kozodoii]|uniref:Uncharacterized protein n=1 Tax=Xenorhabdus kozodoii TaxID=351676 RepID=A0A2D0LAQ9_9GAMM|nr:hypothetical protein Xkoz_02299 [Xenorhabdus kozodoii]
MGMGFEILSLFFMFNKENIQRGLGAECDILIP